MKPAAGASDAKSQSWHIIKIVRGKKGDALQACSIGPSNASPWAFVGKNWARTEVEVEEMRVSVRYNVEI